jgi:hypothetical protein
MMLPRGSYARLDACPSGVVRAPDVIVRVADGAPRNSA